MRSGLFDVESEKASPALEDIASSHMTTTGPQPSFTVTHSSMQVETTPEVSHLAITPALSRLLYRILSCARNSIITHQSPDAFSCKDYNYNAI